MTNKEYIEKNNISFSEAMKMYDNKKYPCINDWLSQEHCEWMFKQGDVIVFSDTAPHTNRTAHVFFVIDSDDNYLYVKQYTRYGNLVKWSNRVVSDSKYNDNSIKIIRPEEQDYFKKIF